MTAQHITDIKVKYGELQSIVDWCSTHCNHQWTLTIKHEAGEEPGIYQFAFEDERDYVTFLVWKQ